MSKSQNKHLNRNISVLKMRLNMVIFLKTLTEQSIFLNKKIKNKWTSEH